MKRTLSLAFAGILLVGVLIGCSGKPAEGDTTKDTAGGTTTGGAPGSTSGAPDQATTGK